MDDIHDHPTVQKLLRGHKTNRYLLVLIAILVAALAGFAVHDIYFIPRSVL